VLLNSFKVIVVRVATSCTPRCANSMIFSAISLVAASSTHPQAQRVADLLKRKRHLTDRFRLESLAGKKWTDRHSCWVS
jgi:hypothetical protein